MLWLAATERGPLSPRPPARLLGAVGLAAGAYLAGVVGAPWRESLVFVAAAALLVLGLARVTLTPIIVAVAALFVGLVSVILRHVEDPTAAALALIGLGVVLVGGVLAAARVRPWRGGGGPPGAFATSIRR